MISTYNNVLTLLKFSNVTEILQETKQAVSRIYQRESNGNQKKLPHTKEFQNIVVKTAGILL